jgi:hypothetical protein
MAASIESNFKKIITGSVSYNSSQLAMGLLITRLKTKYSKNPCEDVLNECMFEVNAFIEKYQRVMTAELEKISNL